MVTKADVAKKAGVSTATVSHVLNNSKYVSPQLKQRVQEAIEALSYRPNIIARSLATRMSKHVGILVNDITNPYYAEIAHGMEEVAHKNGYILSIFFAEGNTEEHFTSILQRKLDGLFFITVHVPFSDNQIRTLHDAGIAMVNGSKTLGSHVLFDYTSAIDSAIRYLSDLGHKRVGFLSGLDANSLGEQRLQMYKKALFKYGLDLDDELVVYGKYPYPTTYESGYNAMDKLLSRNTQLTAVLTTNDLMAFGAFKAIKEAGMSIPEDISIIGCDDIFLAECITPGLTTLRVPKREMGRQAMNLILSELNEGENTIIKLGTSLVIRGSTGPAPKRVPMHSQDG